jgi:CSLREA domain-containing protein
MRRALATSVLLLLLAAPAAPAAPADVTVTTASDTTAVDGVCSLREAIAAAAAHASTADCPGVAASGTTTIALGATSYPLGAQLEVPLGADIALAGAGTATTKIGPSLGRVLQIDAGATVALSQLTITGGSVPAGAAGTAVTNGANGAAGGGILNNGTLAATDVTIANNTSGSGGHGFNATAANGATNGGNGGDGGGIDNVGTLTATRITFTGNATGPGGGGGTGFSATTPGGSPSNGASAGTSGAGGALRNSGTATLTAATFTANATAAAAVGGAGGGGVAAAGNSGSGGGGGTSGNGGAIDSSGPLSINGGTITGNHTGDGGSGGDGGAAATAIPGGGGNGGSGGSGGATKSTAALTLTGLVVSNNHTGNGGRGGSGAAGNATQNGAAGGQGGFAGYGGGLYLIDGTETISSSWIDGNSAGTSGNGGAGGAAGGTSAGAGGNGGGFGENGGGIYVGTSGPANYATLTLTASTVSNNHAGSGGDGGAAGIGAGGVRGNGGGGGGGGAIQVYGTLNATNVTITANVSGGGGAGHNGGNNGNGNALSVVAQSSPGIANLAHVTIAGNTAGVIGHGDPGGLDGPNSNNALIGSGITLVDSIVTTSGACAGVGSVTAHNVSFPDLTCGTISGDPKLGPLQDNSGPVPTMALGAGSSAIDVVPSLGAGCAATDARGVPRPQFGACDAGAYEVSPPPTCTPIAAGTPYLTPVVMTLNCADPAGLPLTYTIDTPPTHGTLSAIGADATVTYTPAAAYSGPDSFTFHATSPGGAAAPTSASIEVGPLLGQLAPPPTPKPAFTSLSVKSKQTGTKITGSLHITTADSTMKLTLAIPASSAAKKTKSKKPVTIGTATVHKLKSGKQTLTVKLDKSHGLAAQHKHKTLKVTLTVSVTPPGDSATTAHKTVTLTRAAPKKQHHHHRKH